MQRLKPYFLIEFVLLLFYFNNTFAQTPIYYSYDVAGNRDLRTITLSKAAKINPKDSLQNLNKNNEIFSDSLNDQKILIYPNPTKGILKIEIIGYQLSSVNTVSVYNFSGKVLISKRLNGSTTMLDLSGYPTGVYILNIAIGDKHSRWKILKE